MKKKGFTLIELMGVIVLIGVIAVIAVPVVKETIKSSRQKSYDRQVDFIVKSAKNWSTTNTDLLPDEGSILVTLETLKREGFLENKNIRNPIDNEQMNGCVVVTYNENYNQYEYNYDEKCRNPYSLAALATTSNEVTSIPACVENGNCDPGTLIAIKVNANEVYNFYVIKDEEDELTLIMDRNIGNNVAWISASDYATENNKDEIPDTCSEASCNDEGPVTAVAALKSRTSNWHNIATREFTYIDDSGANRYTEFTETMKARLLTNEEATKNFNCDYLVDRSCSEWLYQNVYGTGDNNTHGYWMSTPNGTKDIAWFISDKGRPTGNNVFVSNWVGIRPIITISR